MFAHVVHCFTLRWIMIVGPSALVGCFPCLVIAVPRCLTMPHYALSGRGLPLLNLTENIMSNVLTR
ncbi:hypothetical protein M430DRAFT_63184, partial [Amorphotheca resinae ATCC 22711]